MYHQDKRCGMNVNLNQQELSIHSSSMKKKIELILIELGFKANHELNIKSGISGIWKKKSLIDITTI